MTTTYSSITTCIYVVANIAMRKGLSCANYIYECISMYITNAEGEYHLDTKKLFMQVDATLHLQLYTSHCGKCIPLSQSHFIVSTTSSLSGTSCSAGRVQWTSGTMWCQWWGRMVAVEQLQGRRPPGLCPFANRGLTGSWNGHLTTAAART